MKKIVPVYVLASLGLGILALALQSWPLAAQEVAVAQSSALLPASDEARTLIRAAEGQVGVVTTYDPAYVALEFPGGDVAPERGVCTDVLIRALRVAHGIDLQAAINRDMKRNFREYPAKWGLKTTDRNIDHRRVPNLQTLMKRMGAEVADSFQPGDVVTVMLPGNLPHIAIVSDQMGATDPMVIHNIGAGTRVEDRLFEFPHTGHYRLTPEVLARLRALQD